MNEKPEVLMPINNEEVFKKLDEEKKEKQKKEIKDNEFIKSLPDWDLPPLYEKVRRVTRL